MAKLFWTQLEKYILSPIKSHFSALYHRSDPISYHQLEDSKPLKVHFITVIVFQILHSIYGTIGISYFEADESFNWKNITNNPNIYTHQIAPRLIWSQIDFCLVLGTIALCGVMLVFIFTAEIRPKYKIVMQNYDPDEKAKIDFIRGKPKSFVRIYSCSYFIICVIWFWSNVLQNDVYQTGARSILYWTVLFPLACFYITYALFDANLFIILASRYIAIKQQTLLAKFVELNQKMIQPGQVYLSRAHWKQYISLHAQLIHICLTIREYSRFGRPLLSVIFPYYISFQCYLGYVIFMVDFPTVHKQLLIMSVVLANLLLFSITRECARIVSFNNRIEAQSGLFYLNLCRLNRFQAVPGWMLFKAATFQESRRLHRYSFRLFANYRITTKTFYVIITYISTFFMYISSTQYK